MWSGRLILNKKKHPKIIIGMFGLTGILILAWVIQRHSTTQLLYNHSPSMQVGWYLVKKSNTYKKQDVVVLRQPRAAEHLGCVRAKSKVFKRIIATDGDQVCLNQGIITVNDHDFARTQPTFHKHLIWTGCRRINKGQVFLATTHPQSCDSRFYGPIPKHMLWGTARKL